MASTDVDHKSRVSCRFAQCGGAGATCAIAAAGRCDDAAWLSCAVPFSCIRQSPWYWQAGASLSRCFNPSRPYGSGCLMLVVQCLPTPSQSPPLTPTAGAKHTGQSILQGRTRSVPPPRPYPYGTPPSSVRGFSAAAQMFIVWWYTYICPFTSSDQLGPRA